MTSGRYSHVHEVVDDDRPTRKIPPPSAPAVRAERRLAVLSELIRRATIEAEQIKSLLKGIGR